MKNKAFYIATTLIVTISVLWALVTLGSYKTGEPELTEPVKVERVIDGDTIVISGDITVRLIGIDAPESVHPDESKNTTYGESASLYLKILLEDKEVQLEYDIDQEDDYGRTLAYIYLDGEMVNEKLLRDGIAKIMTISPNTKYLSRFQDAELEAKDNNAGFWNNYFKEN